MNLYSLSKGPSLGTIVLAACALGCQASPPHASFTGNAGLVRAEVLGQAEAVAQLLDEIAPQVIEVLPDTVERDLEVWVQAAPALYRFSETTYEEADGFWSEGHQRIHLRESAMSLPRTLAHELVHASLGETWSVLPGTIEEGLCDVVAARLCPREALDLRAGRLSAAAFALGGLELEVELAVDGELPQGLSHESRLARRAAGLRVGCITRLRLLGEVTTGFGADDVFEIAAGLSTTDLPTNDKKALYGLSYLVVHRIVQRSGYRGLHALCLRADREGLQEVPGEWLLTAAGMPTADLGGWRAAIAEEIGIGELRTLLSIYPGLLLNPAERILGSGTLVTIDRSGTAPLTAIVRVPGSRAEVRVRLDIELSGENHEKALALKE